MKLFSHQEAVIPEVLRSLRPDNPTLLVAPTGSGKTVIAADIAMGFRRVLFVAHRIEITEQARAAMGAHVQVMSIHAALKYGPPQVDLLIIDEAHRSTAATYLKIVRKYRGACVLGLTATPYRTDGRGLCEVFDELVKVSSTKDLIERGVLVNYRALEAPDYALKQLSHLNKRCGDYEQRELSNLMNRPRLVGDIVKEYKKWALGRKAIVFAVSVAHSKALRDEFLAAGIKAAHLDGKASPRTRETLLEALASGEIDVLCNVNLFTEGWDCPSVSCIIMARPTASLTLYLQSIGRGFRTHPGKSDVMILDHAGNIERHGLPDDERTWRLESEQQKSKREAEVKELERRLALGWSSVEAELEERSGFISERYTFREAAAILGCKERFVAALLRSFGVPLASGSVRKDHIDKVKPLIDVSCGIERAAEILGVRTKHARSSLKSSGVLPIHVAHKRHVRYSTSEVQALADSRNTGEVGGLITASNIMSSLGITRDRFEVLLSSSRMSAAAQSGRVRLFTQQQRDTLAIRLKASRQAKKCLVCGAEFLGIYCHQQLCGAERCRKKHKADLKTKLQSLTPLK